MTYVSQFPSAVLEVFAAFWEQRADVRLVGGCVRDLVLGVKPKDWDMATPLLPEQTMSLLENAGYKPFDLSNGHGTVSVIINGDTLEITTLRIDAETDGRHAKVVFTDNWRKDAERRDFTFNAMSMDDNGVIYDYFDGQADLNANRIRFVGSVHKRVQEDYLRILRYFRFAARFGMNMDAWTLTAISSNAAGLQKVSGERIWMEMQKILVSSDSKRMLDAMKLTGVLGQIGLITR